MQELKPQLLEEKQAAYSLTPVSATFFSDSVFPGKGNKSQDKQMGLKLESFCTVKELSARWRGSLLNGRRCLRVVHPTRGVNILNIQRPHNPSVENNQTEDKTRLKK